MDMKIGEVREFEGKKYRCIECLSKNNKVHLQCLGCVFLERCYQCLESVFGNCCHCVREDKTNVIFVEVTE